MPDLESKEGERDAMPGQKAEDRAVSDIENALDFLDSGEYREAGHPTPNTRREGKEQGPGKADKPITPESNSDRFPDKEDSTIKTERRLKTPLPTQIEKRPIKIPSGPFDESMNKKSGKTWLLCLGAATLIFFAIFVLYELGYLS